MSDAPDLTPTEARDRWLNKRRVDCSESTISTYHYRLKLFVEWCQERDGVSTVADLSGWDLEEYEVSRREQGVAPSTLHNELKTIRQWLDYLGKIGAVDRGLHEAVDVPNLDAPDTTDDTKLATDAASPLLRYYRASDKHGAREHVLVELAWWTGARVGGIRAIDLRDIELEDGYVWFAHRPDTGTPLKNGNDGQRAVALSDDVVDAISAYQQHYRGDARDKYDRQPLLTSERGRPTPGTLRDWMYHATQPCIHDPCPHGKQMESCEYRTYDKGGGCPSSRSPHQVRTGAITWMLDCGLEPSVVAKRVNATIEVIRRHYDKQDDVQEMEIRRRPHLDKLSLESDT